jgi:DNA-binding MarR family transcriptional regulator
VVQPLPFDAIDEARRQWKERWPEAATAMATATSVMRRGELPLGKMGQRLMIHPTSVTNIVDRLAEDALIERAPHPTDRRTTLARITPEGKALVAKATASVNAVRFGVGMLGDGEMEELIRLVHAMRRSAGDFAPA